MTAFGNLPIARKLLFSFGFVCLLSALLGMTALWGYSRLNANVRDIVKDKLPSVKILGDVRFNIAAVRRSDSTLELCTTEDCVSSLRARRQKNVDKYKASIAAYEPLVDAGKEHELFVKIRDGGQQYLQLSDEILQLHDSGHADDARKRIVDARTMALFDQVSAWIEEDKVMNDKAGSDAGDTAMATGANMRIMTLITVLLVVGMSVLIGMMLNRAISPPLVAAAEALERVAQKDLTVQVEVRSTDEVGRLSQALNQSVQATRDLLTNIARGAETLSSATEELSQRSAESSGNAKSQSAQTNQIAAAAQEMTATRSARMPSRPPMPARSLRPRRARAAR
jgi:methyl-accepting chemotaxis protein